MILNRENTDKVVSTYINERVLTENNPFTVKEFIEVLKTLPQDYVIKRGNLAHDGTTFHSMSLAGVIVEHGEVHII